MTTQMSAAGIAINDTLNMESFNMSYPSPKEQFRSKIERWGFEHDPKIEGESYKGRKVTWAAKVPDDWNGDPNITHAVLIEGGQSFCKIGYRYSDGHISV